MTIKSYDMKIGDLIIPTGRLVIIISLFLFHILSYNFVGQNNTTFDYAHSFLTKLDHILPFVPGMIWIYISTYFVILFAGIIVRDDKSLFHLIEAVFYTWVLTYPFFYFFPAIYPRPSFEVVDLTTKILEYNYSYDVSNNTFPSLHVSLSFVIAFAMLRLKNWGKALWLIWAILVALSTVLIKKHFVVDALGGFIIAYLAYALSFKLKTANIVIGFVQRNIRNLIWRIDKILKNKTVKSKIIRS